MSSNDETDLLMYFSLQGQALAAEGRTGASQADLNSDPLLKDFQVGSFFFIEDMQLGFDTPDAKSRGRRDNTIDMAPVRITRKIDCASPQLMQACVDARTFDKAVIVKRRSAGGDRAGEGYIRFEFDYVLVTKIDWNDSGLIKENVTFIARTVSMTYSGQNADGTHVSTPSKSYSLFT